MRYVKHFSCDGHKMCTSSGISTTISSNELTCCSTMYLPHATSCLFLMLWNVSVSKLMLLFTLDLFTSLSGGRGCFTLVSKLTLLWKDEFALLRSESTVKMFRNWFRQFYIWLVCVFQAKRQKTKRLLWNSLTAKEFFNSAARLFYHSVFRVIPNIMPIVCKLVFLFAIPWFNFSHSIYGEKINTYLIEINGKQTW